VEDGAWLRLLQLHDTALPVGAFAHSNGLEAYAQVGMRPPELESWLRAQLAYGFGRLDLAGVALAWSADDGGAVASLDAELDAWKGVPSLRATSRALGRRTHALAAKLWPERAGRLPAGVANGHHAIVLGAWSRALDLPRRPTLLAAGQGMVAAALAAATRCLPLGPERAQGLLVALQPDVAAAADRVDADPAASLWSATPGADLRAHEQTVLVTRLFES